MSLQTILLKNLLPAVQPYLPQALDQLEEALQQHIDNLPLLDGEQRATLLIMKGQDGRIFITEAFCDSNDRIIRTAHTRPAKSYLNQLITQLIQTH